jgi:hypothetical protein
MTKILSKKKSCIAYGFILDFQFIRYDQDQQHLLPKNLADWVEEDSLERYVSDVINHLDNEGRLDPFYPENQEDSRGRPSFHLVMMLKILVFGYCIGIRSSRKLDRLLSQTPQDVVKDTDAEKELPDIASLTHSIELLQTSVSDDSAARFDLGQEQVQFLSSETATRSSYELLRGLSSSDSCTGMVAVQGVLTPH